MENKTPPPQSPITPNLDNKFAKLEISKENYINTFKNVDKNLLEENKDNDFLQIEIDLSNSENEDENTPSKYYLTKDFTKLPCGLIDKSLTGLGATTLEMKAERNSIIVTPTKNLAYSKYSKDPKNYLYVGSEINEIEKTIDINDVLIYLSKKDINYKKIFVVADSLYKVITALEEKKIDYINDYFLMIDEVDKFMKDSTFREKLETAVDFYFLFNKENRAMITATINDFCNPKIKDEAKTKFVFERPLRNIEIIGTNNAGKECERKIIEILEQNSEEKIFIAINSIEIPLKIIYRLKECYPDIKANIGIACSDNTRNNEAIKDYYIDLNNTENQEKLPKQICFSTSTNFVGIDLRDDYHLISVSTIQKKHHLLTSSDLIQIYGRNRKTDGILSDTFIFESNDIKNNKFDKNTQPELIGIKLTKEEELITAQKYIKWLNEYKRLRFDHKNIDNEILTLRKMIDAENNHVRVNIYGELEIAYFSIDSYSEMIYYWVNVYSTVQNVIEMLRIENMNLSSYKFRIEIHENYTPLTEEQKDDNKKNKEIEIKNCVRILEELENQPIIFNNQIILIKRYLKEIKNSGNTYIAELIQRINELKYFISYREAINRLKDVVYLKGSGGDKYYSELYNGIAFACISLEDGLKSVICHNLEINKEYKRKEIDEFLLELNSQFKLNLKEENHRIRFLESVIQIERKNQSKGNEKFKIISYNKFNITPFKRKTINKILSDMNKKDKTKNQTNIWKGNYFYLPKKRELFVVEQINFNF